MQRLYEFLPDNFCSCVVREFVCIAVSQKVVVLSVNICVCWEINLLLSLKFCVVLSKTVLDKITFLHTSSFQVFGLKTLKHIHSSFFDTSYYIYTERFLKMCFVYYFAPVLTDSPIISRCPLKIARFKISCIYCS